MLRRILPLLLGLAAGLPVVVCILVAVARLLAGLGDTIGATVIDRLALAIGIVWAIDLVFLVISQGFEALNRDEPPDEQG